MNLLRLLTFGSAAAGLLVPWATSTGQGSNTAVQVHARNDDWKTAIPHDPEYNTYYYFMLCTTPKVASLPESKMVAWVIDKTKGCYHVGLVVGKTGRWKLTFSGYYLHARYKELELSWMQTYSNWEKPLSDQTLHYGGTTTASKANLEKLYKAGDNWIKEAGHRADLQYNCLTYYQHLINTLEQASSSSSSSSSYGRRLAV